jgi:hypothetical protein
MLPIVMPRAIRTLSEAEVIDHWTVLYADGKHSGYAKPGPRQYLGYDAVWVEIEVPHDLYAAEWNTEGGLSMGQIKRAEEYARREGPLPPGMAHFTGRLKKKIFVVDGNHRAYAAFLRGSLIALFYMPRNEWERFQQALA